MSTLPNKELLRPDEIARYYGVTTRTVYNWIQDGKLKAVRVAGRLIRIKRTSIANLQRVAE